MLHNVNGAKVAGSQHQHDRLIYVRNLNESSSSNDCLLNVLCEEHGKLGFVCSVLCSVLFCSALFS